MLLGLVDDVRRAAFERKRDAVAREKARLQQTWARPGAISEERIQEALGQPLARESNLLDLLRRPETSYQKLVMMLDLPEPLTDSQEIRQLEIQARYDGYIERQLGEVAKLKQQEGKTIPAGLDYAQVRGLSSEVRQKLSETQPETIGQAGRIPGVTPAAISLLLVHLKKVQKAA